MKIATSTLCQNLKRKALAVQIQSNGYNPDDESNAHSTYQKKISRQAGASSISLRDTVSSIASEPSHVQSVKSDTTHESSPSKSNQKKMNEFLKPSAQTNQD